MAPHPQLPVYADGLLCQLEPSQCQRVLRSIKGMKKHWRHDHQGWSAAEKSGRPSQIKEKRLQARIEQGCTRVHCQRLFGSRHGSQYFQVHQPDALPAVATVHGREVDRRARAAVAARVAINQSGQAFGVNLA
jgi:hypothetical protein